MSWRSVESAPTDGTRVLVLASHGAVEAFWRRSPSVSGRYPASEGWAYSEPYGGLVPFARDVEYWMPLPALPAITAGTRSAET
jgi:hypothetical protein